MLEWKGERASVMEVSHRGQAFIDCAAEAERDLRELMAIPDDYGVLFLQGGATTLSALLPLNLASPDQTCDFILTGHWGEKALENTRPSMKTNVAASAEARETVWLFGLHAVRDALMNPAREKIRLVVTKNALDKLEEAVAFAAIAPEIELALDATLSACSRDSSPRPTTSLSCSSTSTFSSWSTSRPDR